jgi:hypothetical protein
VGPSESEQDGRTKSEFDAAPMTPFTAYTSSAHQNIPESGAGIRNTGIRNAGIQERGSMTRINTHTKAHIKTRAHDLNLI